MPYSKAAHTEPEYMRLSEAAARLDVGPRTVLAMIRDGRLPVRAMNFKTLNLIHREDFEREIAKRLEVGVSA